MPNDNQEKALDLIANFLAECYGKDVAKIRRETVIEKAPILNVLWRQLLSNGFWFKLSTILIWHEGFTVGELLDKIDFEAGAKVRQWLREGKAK